MRPPEEHRTVETSGIMDDVEFGISQDDQAWVLHMLRNTIYSNKVLAVLREYACNARDANPKGVPVEITFPTVLDPQLVIRDRGPGLSHDMMVHVYTKYGKSTKRDDEEAVGYFGIGAKSGFAYGTTFTIRSFHEGVCTTYAAYTNEKGGNTLARMADCPTDETGVEITVPVQDADHHKFVAEAQKLFFFWDTMPATTVVLPKLDRSRCVELNGFLLYKAEYYPPIDKWCAVMGGVPYPLDVSMFPEGMLPLYLKEFFEKARGVITVPMGSVGVNASREALDYNKVTLAYLSRVLAALSVDFEAYLDKQVAHLSGYHKHKELRAIARAFGIKKLKDIDLYADIVIPTTLKSFNFFQPKQNQGYRVRDPIELTWKKPLTVLPWDIDVLWMKDMPLERHKINELFCVVPNQGMEIDRKELAEVLGAIGLADIPLRSIREREQYEKNRSASKPHYSKTHFRHIQGQPLEGTTNWQPLTETEVPAGGVYVMLERYKPQVLISAIPKGNLDACGITPPTLYGVKVLEKPVVIGEGAIPYLTWIQQEMDFLWEDKRLAYLMGLYANSQQVPQTPRGFHSSHPIGKLATHARAFHAAKGLRLLELSDWSNRQEMRARRAGVRPGQAPAREPCASRTRFAQLVTAFRSLNVALKHPRYVAAASIPNELQNLNQRYPLIMEGHEFHHLFLNSHKNVAVHQYVNLIDKENPF